MTADIESDATRRDIQRLCHFAPARNLTHILSDGEIRPTSDLRTDQGAILNPTDEARLDGYPDHISCSIESPNVWYLQRARERSNSTFPTWVILFLHPRLLWRSGTKFAPRNAAAGHGSLVVEGYAGLQAMFAPTVQGAGGRTYVRTNTMLPSTPTDNQAEVLVPGSIPLEMVTGIAVPDEDDAREIWVAADTLGNSRKLPGIVVARGLFNPNTVTAATRSGNGISMTPWTPDD